MSGDVGEIGDTIKTFVVDDVKLMKGLIKAPSQILIGQFEGALAIYIAR